MAYLYFLYMGRLLRKILKKFLLLDRAHWTDLPKQTRNSRNKTPKRWYTTYTELNWGKSTYWLYLPATGGTSISWEGENVPDALQFAPLSSSSSTHVLHTRYLGMAGCSEVTWKSDIWTARCSWTNQCAITNVNNGHLPILWRHNIISHISQIQNVIIAALGQIFHVGLSTATIDNNSKDKAWAREGLFEHFEHPT